MKELKVGQKGLINGEKVTHPKSLLQK